MRRANKGTKISKLLNNTPYRPGNRDRLFRDGFQLLDYEYLDTWVHVFICKSFESNSQVKTLLFLFLSKTSHTLQGPK